MSWFWLIFISVNFSAISSIFDKFFCAKKFKNVLSYMTFGNLLQLPLVCLLLFFTDFSNLSGKPLYFTILSSPIFFAMWLFYYRALKTVEASRAMAVFNVMPVFTVFLAGLFLLEEISLLKWLAIFLIIIGATLCAYENQEREKRFKFNFAYFLIILAAFLAAIGNTFSKFAVTKINPLTVYVVSYLVGLPLCPLLSLFKKEVFLEIRQTMLNKRVFFFTFIGRLLNFLATVFFYLSLAHGPLSLIAPVYGIGPMLVFIYSTILSIFFPQIIKEKITPAILFQKAVAIALIVVGVVIINK